MTDTWAAFDPQPAEGADAWAHFDPQQSAKPARTASTAIDVVRGNPFAMGPSEAGFARAAPEAFLDRMRRGAAIERVLKAAGQGVKEGFGDEPVPVGEQMDLALARDLGIAHQHSGRPAAIFANLDGTLPMAIPQAFSLAMRSINAGLHGAGGALGELVDIAGGQGEQVRREAINLGNFFMVESGFGRFTRHKIAEESLREQPIGGLPKDADFKAGAEVLGDQLRARLGLIPETAADVNAVAEQNLRTLWEERGIHPAEAVHDAQSDAWLKQELTTVDSDPATKLPAEAWSPEDLVKQVMPGGRGPRLRDPETWSLLEFIASRGGIDPADPLIGDVRGLFGGKRKFIPGFGDVIRTGGMRLDTMREAAVEAGYLADSGRGREVTNKSTVTDLLNAMDTESRGRKVYRHDREPEHAQDIESARVLEDNRRNADEGFDAALHEAGIKPDEVPDKTRDRVLEIMTREGEADPLIAYERAVMEETHDGAAAGQHERIPDAIPGWDLPHDTGAAPSAGRAAAEGGERATGEAARSVGASDRGAGAAAGDVAEPGAEGKPQILIPGVEPITQRQRLEAQAGKPLSGGNAGPKEGGLFDTDARAQTELPLRALGADVATTAPTLAEQPPPPPGRLIAAAREAAEKVLDIGRDIQMMVAPMARGTRDSMALAKDFANTLRRNRWEWSRIDSDIEKRFTPEQRKRMWDAADEESVARQEQAAKPPDTLWYQGIPAEGVGKPQRSEYWTTNRELASDYAGQGGFVHVARQTDLPSEMVAKAQGGKTDSVWMGERRQVPTIATLPRDAPAIEFDALARPGVSEHMGLATLEPAERAAVEDLQTRAQTAWLRARDLGMVEGEGLPAYTPRMLINTANAAAGEKSLPLNSIGGNLRTTTPQMRHRKHMTAEETEVAAKAKFGDEAEIARDIRALPLATAKLEDAIAGRSLIEAIKDYGKRTGDETVTEGGRPGGSEHQWFTLDHPAFRTWRPKFEEVEGKVVAAKNAAGDMIFEQVPIYVRSDFEGPLRAVLTQTSGPTYGAFMALKGKTMSLIMNSPMIHNAVEFGRAFPALPTRIFKAYFDGNRAKNDVSVMREAIDAGLVPIGKRFFNQDISSIMEAPDLTPGRSWTAKVLGFVPGLFDEGAGVTVKSAIDKAGDFWHNTLLWDRIADLQMGIYVNMQGDLLAKGMDRRASSIVAAHLANRYAGALPQEAMSAAATKVSNFLLFSRTFTMGNLGVLKDVFTGLPKDVLAQIERDVGVVNPEAVGYAKSVARRKAMMTLGLDVALAYVGYSLFQSASSVLLMDRSLSEEAHGYVRRLRDLIDEVKVHPLSLLQPFSIAERLGATGDNEPSRKERVHVGNTKDGTAIYARNPVGKIGEEFVGYLSSPLDMLKRKEGTIARPLLQVLSNDKGFGRKIYDPNAETYAKYAENIWNIVKHVAVAQTPEGQLSGLADLVKGEGDAKLNAMQAFGPLAGVSFSKGAPGGPAVGELYRAREIHNFKVDAALPDIRKQIQRGDLVGAQSRMTELGIPAGLQRFYIKTSLYPETRLNGRTLRDFYMYATPEQRDRLERARQ